MRINEQGEIAYYKADVVSAIDYYPFGSLMPNRNFSSNRYRYGYQGSEKDDAINGNGNSYTTYFRQLDPRLGRWMSLDPKKALFPHMSPYASMDNNPIAFNDQKGDCPQCFQFVLGFTLDVIEQVAEDMFVNDKSFLQL